MLTKLVISTASLIGIILVIFWIANWMGQRIVIEARPPKCPKSHMPRETFWDTMGPISLVVIGVLAVAAYFTLALSGIVFSLKHVPMPTNMLLTAVFMFVMYKFFLFLFEILGKSAANLSVRLIAFSFGCAISYLWTFYPSWLTINLGATLASITMLVMLGTIPLRMLAIVAIGVTLYDVVAVFGTGQMIEAAKSIKDFNLPMLFIIPESLDLSSRPANMLGLGDVAIPGALIMAALKKNIRHVCSWTLLGYFIGLAVAMGVVYLTRFPQPATIYLVPGVLVGVVLAAHRAGMLREAFASEKRDTH